jgi:hypothetical protein
LTKTFRFRQGNLDASVKVCFSSVMANRRTQRPRPTQAAARVDKPAAVVTAAVAPEAVAPGPIERALVSVRVAEDLRRLVGARQDAEQALAARVADARAEGASWAVIGQALGVTRQAAYERYGRSTATVLGLS